jgi:predicted O-methyltransferase YrrM
MEKITIIIRYLKHWLGSVNEHGVHSPFLFKLITEGVYRKQSHSSWKKLEAIRTQLLADKTALDVTDLGAGSLSDGKPTQRKVSFICRSFAKSPRLCRVLFKIVHHLKPNHILELGTSLGMSTMYLASANPEAQVTTIEGCPNTAAIANHNFKVAGINNIESLTGDFGQVLPTWLAGIKDLELVYIDGNHTYEATLNYFHMLSQYANAKTVIIFDDIHLSKGMEQAWREIHKDQRVTMSVDMFHFGMVFFDNRFSKEHFKIRI